MSTIFHVRGNRVIHLCAACLLTSLALGTTGCATAKIVPGPDRVNVLVYPMHGTGVQEPMTNVARLQCSGNGFILLSVDGNRVTSTDYVEVLPGRHTLLLIPRSIHLSTDYHYNYKVHTFLVAKNQFLLSLDAKPCAWYHFCTYRDEIEASGTWESITQSSIRTHFAPFEVIEINDGKERTVATPVDFVPQ